MDFSYTSYQRLIELLRKHAYEICSYFDYQIHPKCAILRHDLDFSISDGHAFSLLETSLGVTSTYYVLLSTGFYNPLKRENRVMLQDMIKRGFEIGLHFDETAYPDGEIHEHVASEASILSQILDTPIRTVSMHRPSRKTLESNYSFTGLLNSYEHLFFKEFKYCSDSRFCWRDDPESAVTSGNYARIHILTHPFAWSTVNRNPAEVYRALVDAASWERYVLLTQNIRCPEEFIEPANAWKRWVDRLS